MDGPARRRLHSHLADGALHAAAAPPLLPPPGRSRLWRAAATGAIAGAAFVLGKRAIFDVPTAAIAAVALLVLVKARKVPEPVLMLAAGAAGLILRGGSVR